MKPSGSEVPQLISMSHSTHEHAVTFFSIFFSDSYAGGGVSHACSWVLLFSLLKCTQDACRLVASSMLQNTRFDIWIILSGTTLFHFI
jgi:hypothetical protein